MNWDPWAGSAANYHLSIAGLVANGTMDAAIAGTLWAAAAEQLSFLTVAMPRGAGKTTVASAVLALRPPGVDLHPVLADPAELEQLRRDRRGGYLVVGEFSPWSMPSYIWGDRVHDVFRTLDHGYSLQTSLHATGVTPAIQVVTREIGVPDTAAAHFKLVVYIEVSRAPSGEPRRRIAEVFELDAVEGASPVGRTLHRWQPETDTFTTEAEPQNFAPDRDILHQRREAIAALTTTNRTSIDDVAALVATFPQP